jgi:hypothetical protein
LLESAIVSTCRELERSWYDNIVFEDRKPRELAKPIIHLESYLTDRQQRLRGLFDTIEFLISLGLRLPESPKEFQRSWIYEISTKGLIILSPKLDRWPWEAKDDKPGIDCWTTYSFMSSVETFRFYLERACATEDEPDSVRFEMKEDLQETETFDPKESLSKFSWLRRPDPTDCGCEDCVGWA